MAEVWRRKSWLGARLARRRRGALDEPGAAAGEPPELGGRARRRVRSGAIDKPAATQASETVVDGALGTTGECDQLRRGEHAVGVEQHQQVVVDQ